MVFYIAEQTFDIGNIFTQPNFYSSSKNDL